MSHADLHIALRESLRGSGCSTFMVTVESSELHPGRVEVDWRISIFEGDPSQLRYHYRGRDPFDLLARIRAKLIEDARARQATEPPPPPELVAVGPPPSSGRA